jgi:hypothetical protein
MMTKERYEEIKAKVEARKAKEAVIAEAGWMSFNSVDELIAFALKENPEDDQAKLDSTPP